MSVQGFHKKNIPHKQSLGAQLKSARKKKHLSLEKAEQETKIRLRYLAAMEDDDLYFIPSAYTKGYVRRYGDYLGLSSSLVESELEIAIQKPLHKQPFSPQTLERETRWLITPRTIAIVFSVLVLLSFIGYVTYQVRQFAAPPVLAITKPVNETVSTTEIFVIEGRTDPGVIISIDNLQASVSSDGIFTYPVTLRPGLNQIVIRAENRIKKQTTKVVSILFQASEPSPSPVPSPQQ